MKISQIKNKRLMKAIQSIVASIEQDKNIFRHLQELRDSMCTEGESVLNDVRERYLIDRFVHVSTKESQDTNHRVESTEFNDASGKMTMVLVNGRTIRKKLNNFTQYARPLISTAKKEDEVIIQIVLMMDHAEEILFSECVNEVS